MDTYEVSADRSSATLNCCRLGVGVDTGRVEARSTPLAVDAVTAPSVETPALRDAVTYTLEAVDRSELQNESTSFRGSFRVSLAVLSGKVSGGATFADSSSRTTSFIRASVRVVKYVQTMDVTTAKLLPGIDTESADFEELYGDSVVAAVTYGGRLDALIRVKQEEKEELRDFDVKGEIDAVVAKASGSFRQRLVKATSGREVDIEIEQRGGRLQQVKLAPSVENLLQAVKEFPGQVRSEGEDTAVPLAFTVLRYQQLPEVIRRTLVVKGPVGTVTKEALLMEQVARTVQQYEIARRIVSGRIDIGGVLGDKESERAVELRRLLLAYRNLVTEKAKAMEVLVRASLDATSLTEEVVDRFPLAFQLVHGGSD